MNWRAWRNFFFTTPERAAYSFFGCSLVLSACLLLVPVVLFGILVAQRTGYLEQIVNVALAIVLQLAIIATGLVFLWAGFRRMLGFVGISGGNRRRH